MKYFTHRTTLRFEPESRKMIRKFGLEGYGLYLVFLETAAETVSTKTVDPRLSESIEDLADYFNKDSEDIAEMAAYALAENIIQMDNEHIICKKVHELLDEYLSKSSVMRSSLDIYKDGSRNLPEAEQVLEYLNELLTQDSRKRGYKVNNDNITAIQSRLAAGFSIEDCKRVCLYKYNDWNDTESAKYLRPKTLFRKSNFEGYLNASVGDEKPSEEAIRASIRLES